MFIRTTRPVRNIGPAFLVAVGSCAALVHAQVPIPIANAGFEADLVSEGCFEVLDVTDWNVFDPNGIMNANNVVGGINLPPGSVYFPAGAPEGDHAALVYLAASIGAGPMGLTQVLGETLQANTTYTLSAQVGNIASGTGPPPCDVFGFFDLDGFPGYQVQLLAGGVIVGQDDNSLAGTLLEGEFDLSTTQICIGADHPQLGETLEVRLINLNLAETPEDPGIEVDFDDVQLTRQPNGASLPSNLDQDCDVDLDDYALLAACMNGPNLPPSPTCPQGVNADIDNDGDVDLEDAAALARQFTGPQ